MALYHKNPQALKALLVAAEGKLDFKLNKLRGEHLKELDAVEFKLIIDAGGEEDLKSLLALSSEQLQTYFDYNIEEVEFHETFEVVVSCTDEAEQEAVYNKLMREGYKCRVLTL